MLYNDCSFMSKPDNGNYLHRPRVLNSVLKDHSRIANISVGEINAHLDLARALYPDNLCIKNVYATMEGADEFGNTFEAFARNGIPTASPEALVSFSAGNMLDIARSTRDPHLNSGIDYLKARPGEALIGCALLNEQMLRKQIETCLKGYNPKTGKFRPDSAKDCPNQQAGNCAERVLISWLPYIYSLLKNGFEGGGVPNKYIIREVRFNQKHIETPTIIYKVDGDELWSEVMIKERTELKDSQKETLFTEVLPCTDCARSIVYHKIETVNILDLSRHMVPGFQEIDGDDINSLEFMINHGVIANFPKSQFTQTRPRN